jgi:hypothetical protein
MIFKDIGVPHEEENGKKLLCLPIKICNTRDHDQKETLVN